MSRSIIALAATLSAFVATGVEMVQAQQRAPQGFIFDCDTGTCPSGPYQDKCAQCAVLSYDDGATCIQCMCFDSNKKLQDASTMRSSQNCAQVNADDNGNLVCDAPTVLRGGKKGKSKAITANPTGAPFAATKAPTVGTNLVQVDFNFNCVEGDCPTGPYQTFCPRCDVNTDSTPPNDPRPSISCQCFNGNGQMLLRTSTMWNFQLCPKIVTSFGGQLGCVGAGKAQGITVYGGRRELSAGSEEVDAEIREEDALIFKN